MGIFVIVSGQWPGINGFKNISLTVAIRMAPGNKLPNCGLMFFWQCQDDEVSLKIWRLGEPESRSSSATRIKK